MLQHDQICGCGCLGTTDEHQSQQKLQCSQDGIDGIERKFSGGMTVDIEISSIINLNHMNLKTPKVLYLSCQRPCAGSRMSTVTVTTVPPAATRSLSYLTRSATIALVAPTAGASSSPPMVGDLKYNLNPDQNGMVARLPVWQTWSEK